MKRTSPLNGAKRRSTAVAGAVLAVVVAGVGVMTAPALAAPNIPLDAAASVLAAGTAELDFSGLTITGHLGDVSRDVLINPYTVGEEISYSFKVANNRPQTVTVVPVSGSFAPFVPADGAGNCRWTGLGAGANYTCATPKHTVTAADLAAGSFATATTWQVGNESKTLSTAPVALRAKVDTSVGQVSISGTPSNPQRNTVTNPYAPGEALAYTFTVKNNGTTSVTVTPNQGHLPPSCRPTVRETAASSISRPVPATAAPPPSTP
ncbi:hypothetical protein NHF46_19185 [Arthrobacter alpinus]|nr:hypothetical protein [Arthrobacter alpinus]